MHILENHSLKSLNTFGVDVTARWFVQINSADRLQQLIADPKWNDFPKLILGGGSNILFTKDFDGLVIHNVIKGMDVTRENDESVLLKAASGEVWHDIVMFAVGKGWGGIENLSLIPGFVGAAPIQNIGAYGAELSEVLEQVEATEITTGASRTFAATDCQFGYRYSVFKGELKDRFVTTSITLRLSKKPEVETSYGAVAETLGEMGITQPTIRDVSNAVIDIRRSKLPNPAEIGNAGSFFKNPVISIQDFEEFKKGFPSIPSYPQPDSSVKIPAGWLIEKAGWKGKRIGNVGMHEKQALVLVNYGGATGHELHSHAMTVKKSVGEKYGIALEEEVRIC